MGVTRGDFIVFIFIRSVWSRLFLRPGPVPRHIVLARTSFSMSQQWWQLPGFIASFPVWAYNPVSCYSVHSEGNWKSTPRQRKWHVKSRGQKVEGSSGDDCICINVMNDHRVEERRNCSLTSGHCGKTVTTWVSSLSSQFQSCIWSSSQR